MTDKTINGIDVSESVLTATNNDVYYSQNAVDELQNNIKRLQEENEKLRQDWRLDCLKCEYKNTKADVDKYKQALEEIREIAKYNQFYNPKYFMLRGDIGQVQNIRMTEIYNKINEVFGNE